MLCFKPVHSRSLQIFAASSPKITENDVTKNNFLKNVLTGFSEILIADVKLRVDKVSKVLRRYLLSSLSYRGNTGGGG